MKKINDYELDNFSPQFLGCPKANSGPLTRQQSVPHDVVGLRQSHMRVTREPRNDVAFLSPAWQQAGFE